MRVLVTGGAGFIGSHTVDQLVDQGHDVTVLDNLSSGKLAQVHPQAKFVFGDILQRQDLQAVFQPNCFDAVLHFAAQTMVSISQTDPAHDAELNITGTVLLLRAACAAGVKRFVFSSSAAVYGDSNELPIREITPQQPMSFYGLSKLTAERYISMIAAQTGMEYIIFRYANVYGERQGDNGEGGVISIFARKILEEHPMEVFGDGNQTRDFIYVGDVARANCRALLTESVNAVYNISSHTETTVNRLVEIFQIVSQRNCYCSYSSPRIGDIFRSFLTHDQAARNLQWTPEVSLIEGVRRTFESLL